MSKKTISINFFAGPGAGKSTQAAFTFANLKMQGISAELVTEYAKGLVWQKSYAMLKNQLYIFAKQAHHMERVSDGVEVIVTDSPLLQNLAYAEHMSETFHKLVNEEVDKYLNINILLIRNEIYDSRGRMQTKEEAIELDNKTIELIAKNGHEIHKIIRVGSNNVQEEIVNFISEQLSTIRSLNLDSDIS